MKSQKVTEFTTVVETKAPPKAFVGFRILEIPLGQVREIIKTHPTPGAVALCDALAFESDLVAIQVNEFDGGLKPVKNPNGFGYKKLTSHTPLS